MRIFRFTLLLALGLFLFYQHYTSVSSLDSVARPNLSQSSDSTNVELSGSVPKKALQVLEIVRRTGLPPEGYVGGRVFQNREGRLPSDGEYREFDVDPHNGGRNAERIIVEWQTKKAWYTGDHYRTFVPLP